METLPSQFEAAVSNVTISGAKLQRAIDAHTEVRTLLEADPKLREWGIDSILIGSYARHTARYPGKDVDIFLRLTNLSTSADPKEVYDRVATVLVQKYGLKENGGRVVLQARSVKIEFASPNAQADLAFSVDAVPAVPWGQHWGIPNRDPSRWTAAETRWIKTDPVAFASESETLSTAASSPTVGGRDAYKPVVRLLRQVRHVHLGDAKPGGLYVEIAAFYAWRSGQVSGGSWAELVAGSLRTLSTSFADAATAGLKDPILGTPLSPALSSEEWRAASALFGSLADKAAVALESSPCRAAKLWREILGTNDRGQVLPLPDGCGADGLPIPGVAAVSSTGPNKARGFARQAS